MSSREHQLISRIIRTGCLNDVLAWGISNSDFKLTETRALFGHLTTYFQQYQSVVGPTAATHLYPTFQLCDDQYMATPALCQEVRNNRITLDANQGINDIQMQLQSNPLEAIAALSNLTNHLTSLIGNNGTDVRLEDALQRLWHKYHLTKHGVDFSICPWPWEPIQRVTGGVQPSDYIVLYGRPKSMKSWVLSYFVAWCFKLKKRSVIYTKEMTAEDMTERIVACIAEVDAMKLHLGQLSVDEEWRVYYAMKEIEAAKAGGDIVILSAQDIKGGGDTVPWLASKVDKYKPHFCFVDGMYLMSDVNKAKKDNERVQNISRELRQLSLSKKIGLVATLQANRQAAKHSEGNLEELAFSDAIGQDATHIFRTIKEKDSPTVMLVTAGGRTFDIDGWRIRADLGVCDFSYYGDLNRKEIEKAKEKDKNDSNERAMAKMNRPAAHDHTASQELKGGQQAVLSNLRLR